MSDDHPHEDQRDPERTRIADPDAPGADVDDTEAPEVNEPNEPA